MRKKHLLFVSILVLGLVGCGKDRANNQVVSERYIHKYGYDVPKEEWNDNNYPGQVITALRNGVTITSHYEDGRLHGTTTYTFPHSTTLESAHLYDRGQLIKKTSYNLHGAPVAEEVHLGDAHKKFTTWSASGTPLRIEEYEFGKLLEGEYFTINNRVESRVEKGEGVRTSRNEKGQLLYRDTIENGEMVLRTEYYAAGTPKAITPYAGGFVHGVRKTYAAGGEPLSIEEWNKGVKHGTFAYFQNGAKYIESQFFDGKKEGIERHFVDGDTLVEESEWHGDRRHGPSMIYLDGYNKIEWYYDNMRVSKEKYDELCDQEKHIAKLSERSASAKVR